MKLWKELPYFAAMSKTTKTSSLWFNFKNMLVSAISVAQRENGCKDDPLVMVGL